MNSETTLQCCDYRRMSSPSLVKLGPGTPGSVCLSVKRMSCDKTEERSVYMFIPYERPFSLVFWEEEWLVGVTHSTWDFGPTGPRCSEIADFEPIFARSESAVTPGEKSSINTHRKFTTRFPMSLRWSLYVAPKPPRGLKNANGRFLSKIELRLKKVCYKVSLCENCQRQSCKAFIGLTICAKMVGGGDPLYLKFWIKMIALERNRRFSISFRSWRLSRNT